MTSLKVERVQFLLVRDLAATNRGSQPNLKNGTFRERSLFFRKQNGVGTVKKIFSLLLSKRMMMDHRHFVIATIVFVLVVVFIWRVFFAGEPPPINQSTTTPTGNTGDTNTTNLLNDGMSTVVIIIIVLASLLFVLAAVYVFKRSRRPEPYQNLDLPSLLSDKVIALRDARIEAIKKKVDAKHVNKEVQRFGNDLIKFARAHKHSIHEISVAKYKSIADIAKQNVYNAGVEHKQELLSRAAAADAMKKRTKGVVSKANDWFSPEFTEKTRILYADQRARHVADFKRRTALLGAIQYGN